MRIAGGAASDIGVNHADGRARGVDGAGGAVRDATGVFVGFARTLAAAGLPVGPGRTAAFLAAIHALEAANPRDVYWAGRCTMAAEPDDLPVYDAVFAAYFSGRTRNSLRPRQRTLQTTVPLPARDDETTPDADAADQQDSPIVRARATEKESLQHRDMARLTAEERAEAVEYLAERTRNLAKGQDPAKERAAAIADLTWSLVASSEFRFNH